MARNDDASSSCSEEWIKVEAEQLSANTSANLLVKTDVNAGAPLCAKDDISAKPGTMEGTMQLHLRPHVDAVAVGEASDVLAMASLRVPGIGNTPRLSRLDIVVVIDRSGSMSGLRLQLVEQAVRFMSKQLRSGDRLAIVSYSDNATVDLPLRLMDAEGQQQCSQALAGMRAFGCTNLGEGLLGGLGELASSDAPAAAMLLFTDGLANRGMQETDELVEAMQGPMSDMGRQSRAVFTFGLGADHNAQMLFSLADAGTGCYYFVDTAQAIAPSFADCLGGMLSVAAQDVMLTLHTTNGVAINNVHADFNVDMCKDNTEARIRMRDLSGDAEKEVLFTLSVPAFPQAIHKGLVLTCKLSYIDVADGAAKTQEGELTLRGFEDGSVKVEPDALVDAHRCRLVTSKAMEEAAVLLGKGGSLSDVQVVLSEALGTLENSPARASTESSVHERMASLIGDLSLCLETASNPRECEKLCSSRGFAHKHQISTRAEGSEYRNTLQQNLAEAARREIGASVEQEQQRPQGRRGRHGGGYKAQNRESGNSYTKSVSNPGADTILAGAVRVGMRIMCRGQPGVVQEVSMSKTGKHGHAKVFFTVVGDDGVKRQDIFPASVDVELAVEHSLA